MDELPHALQFLLLDDKEEGGVVFVDVAKGLVKGDERWLVIRGRGVNEGVKGGSVQIGSVEPLVVKGEEKILDRSPGFEDGE